jgi:glycosyltransferase involved in cell wall biosynthesis
MPHYHKTIPHDRFVRAVSCILAQSHPGWELLIYHDGPVEDPTTQAFAESLTDPRIHFEATVHRHGDWGHSLRDLGINAARGEYIFNTNSDNVLYPHCLAILAAYSLWPKRTLKLHDKRGEANNFVMNPDLLVYGVKMMGCINTANLPGFSRVRGQEEHLQLVLPGWPPNKHKIDAMQLVARRELWLDSGGWNDRSEESDGDIIQHLTRRHGYLVVPEVLGEHW